MKSIHLVIGSLVCVFMYSVNPTAANAQSDEQVLLESLLTQLQELQSLVAQRVSFAESGATSTAALEYFNFNLPNGTVVQTFGSESHDLVIETDLDVTQLVLVADCSEGDIRTFGSNVCATETWIMNSVQEGDWTSVFTIPVSIQSDTSIDLSLDVYACRFNGCMYEGDVAIANKPSKEYVDDVAIIDRYEWQYEQGDNKIHEQEVLISVPLDGLHRIGLDVTCTFTKHYLRTYSDERTGCSQEYRYSQPDFRDEKTDELGNVYNLLVYSVSKNLTAEEAGSIAMTFEFFDLKNKSLGTLVHVPQQFEEEEG